jgi:ribosome-associated protein
MKKNEIRAQVAAAVRACQNKKATDISILQLDPSSSGFTDYFVICSGSNPRQLQAIADDVDQQLSAMGQQATHTEGYNQGEWVLLDYVDFVVHIFSEGARKFYDLERLWKTATRLQPADLDKPAPKPVVKKTAAPVTAAKRAAAKKAAKSPTRSQAKSAAKSAARKRPAAPRSRKGS